MFIKTLSKEFIFDCQVRDLAPRTIRNYEKQLGYFVSQDHFSRRSVAGKRPLCA